MKIQTTCGILGATGVVGDTLRQLLQNHPSLKLSCLAASQRSSGKVISSHTVQECRSPYPAELLFSALPSTIAMDVERDAVEAGYTVVSNASAYRCDESVPLVVPEVNGHLVTEETRHVTNPNCVVAGLSIVLKALHDKFGLEAVQVVTLQAISGAGYPGVPSLDILGNVIPTIRGESEKIEREPCRILELPGLPISAQVNRVPVRDGHLSRVGVRLTRQPPMDELKMCLEEFKGLNLPSAPKQPIRLVDEWGPQPARELSTGTGMEVWIGQVEACPVMGVRLALLSHNLIRGAAGAALLNAELLQRVRCTPSAYTST